MIHSNVFEYFETLLSDQAVRRHQPFLIHRGGGRPPRNHRRVLDAVFWLRSRKNRELIQGCSLRRAALIRGLMTDDEWAYFVNSFVHATSNGRSGFQTTMRPVVEMRPIEKLG